MAEQQPSNATERLRDVMREGFTLMLGAASWAYEQGDKLVGTWMDQGNVTRVEGRRKFDEFATRTRKTGEEWGRAVSDRVRTATSSVPVASRDQVESLERRIEELTRQIEELKAGGSASAGAATTRPVRRPGT
jgi:polyhydroxyalkanoate synthesis regulator phasin